MRCGGGVADGGKEVYGRAHDDLVALVEDQSARADDAHAGPGCRAAHAENLRFDAERVAGANGLGEANFFDAGWLGRKSGRGFYHYKR